MIAHYKRTWNVRMATLAILGAIFYAGFTAVVVLFGPSIVRQAIADRQWVLLVLPLGFLVGWGVWTLGMLSLLGPETAVEITKKEFSMRSGFSSFSTRYRYRLSEMRNAYVSDVGSGLHHLILEMKDGSVIRIHTLLSATDLRDIVDKVRARVKPSR